MIKIPDSTKRISQTNESNLTGNIFYTKNINFDEKGYIKLSPRSISITNSKTDTDFNILSAVGRKADSYYLATTENPYEGTISETSVSILKDTDNGGADSAPDLGFDSHGTWWQNLWQVTTETDLYTKDTATGNWTARSLSLTTGVTHDVEVFRNSPNRTLCIGNGNSIMQINTSYSTSGITQLTISDSFEILSLAYNSDKMGIAVKSSDTASGQNGEAFFYLWDGASTKTDGAWGVGSDVIIGLEAYKSSWVLLTRSGELLMFNGGGFTKLGQLPVKSLDFSWGDGTNREGYGDIMEVKGDKIYFHINNRVNSYGQNGEIYIPQAPGGILCYDPNIGIYHRYSPSTSQANHITVTSANINTSTDILTKTNGALYTTGTPIKYVYDGTTPIGGLKVGTVYYIIKHTSSTFSLATTPQNAIDGVKIDITGTGASNNYFLALNLVDYGATRMERTGGMGITAQKNNVLGEIVFGGEYIDGASGSNYEYFNLISEGFTNKGYVVTSKIASGEISDVIKNIYIKYRPLNTFDVITVKEKSNEIMGLPLSTPQYGVTCTWTDTDTFTTTANLSSALTYLNASEDNECEVEIISGSGAGSTAQISSLTYSTGTYTVVLDQDIDGVTVGYYCDIVVDNWRQLGTITSDDVDGIKTFQSGKSTRQALYKIELTGSNVTIEEIGINNSTFQTST